VPVAHPVTMLPRPPLDCVNQDDLLHYANDHAWFTVAELEFLAYK
jgi:hypothetical protein